MKEYDDIKAYLDGELPEERMSEMRAAFEADPQLRHEAADFERITAQIREMKKIPPVEGLERTLDRMGHGAPPWSARKWTWAAPALACCAAAMIITTARQDASVLLGLADPAGPSRKATVDLAKSEAASTFAAPKRESDWKGAPQEHSERLKSPENQADPNLDRRVGFAAEITVSVPDLQKAKAQLLEDVERLDGEISVIEEEAGESSLLVTVPSPSLPDVLLRTERLGTRQNADSKNSEVKLEASPDSALSRADEQKKQNAPKTAGPLQHPDPSFDRDKQSVFKVKFEEVVSPKRLDNQDSSEPIGRSRRSAAEWLAGFARNFIVMSPLWIALGALIWWLRGRRVA